MTARLLQLLDVLAIRFFMLPAMAGMLSQPLDALAVGALYSPYLGSR